MTENVYAHSVSGQSEDVWELLADHLKAVAAKAARLAEPFGGGVMAEAMGALHDAGKANPAFQAYIRGLGPGVDHSTAGAVIAAERYGPVLGRMMAFGIAGHHAGLANGRVPGGGLSSLSDRLAGCRPHRLTAEQDVAPAAATLTAPVLSEGFTHSFSLPFLIRMLFSCLIDADRLETERFDAGTRKEKVDRGCPLTIGDLRGRLDRHLSQFDAASGPVNALRAEVLAAVRAGSEQAPGLFSLTVPTGGGKTLASLAFALDHAERHNLRRVIYVIPFTSIVEQTADVFRTALGDRDAVLEHHSGFDFGPGPDKGKRASDDSEEEGRDGIAKLRRAAENWDRPIVVTTAVQFFESLFSNRTSPCRKLHAIAGSVVILDEAQTLPLKYLLPCLEALRELARGYRTSVVLCTATQPAVTVESGFKGGLEAVRELAPDPQGLYRRLKRVTVERIREPLGDEELAERLRAERQVLCIVNNRRHARDLLRRVSNGPNDPESRHLSTCLCAAHRRAELAAIRKDLKRGAPVRLVATSLVEAGVDFSFPTVYRAMAGLDSIAQAAGRCNRDGELPELGRVFVFSSPDSENRKPPPELSQFAEVAASILRTHDDPLGLDTIRAYFQRLYWQRGREELDAALVGEGSEPIKGILEALRLYQRGQDYPFADIAKAFRIIESPLVPVIVPYRPADDPDIVHRLVGALRNPNIEKVGGIARAFQPYLVQIPRGARNALIAAGAAEYVRRDEFGEQFALLVNGDLYHPDVGLDWEDPTFRKIETGIF
ncbi:CRISPR-associated Cas3 family helicase [Azospirillum brasilense]|uniref:CRISPR-associated Cas3 family helicase n=1 Tax=Azospirillum brasilense TaxID=192 RepID=A0A560B3Z8_AZOBR|nr:CRISPR-associated endonuclease Cas3'' [Azospirillum brasilense]TWA67351.1 CRISPR-associated Cas3 family helicase [Azospirillum brasilense]